MKPGISIPCLAAIVFLAACSDMGSPLAQGPLCRLSDTSLAFGDVLVGDSATRSLTVYNDGDETLTVDIAASCGDFAVTSGAGPHQIGAGQSMTIQIELSPSQEGAANCQLTIDGDCVVALSGVGVTPTAGAQCDVAPTALDFGQVEVGSSADRGFTITNNGSVNFSGQVVSFDADFDVVQGGGSFTLTPAQTLNVSVRYTPSALGSASGTVSLGVDCGDVGLSGEGIAPPATVSYAAQIQPIFTSTCATVGCHRSPNPAGNLTLSTGASYANLVNVQSYGYRPALRVKPGDPSASVLYNKVAGTGVYGRRMPSAGTGLSTAQIDLIRNWILEGALDN